MRTRAHGTTEPNDVIDALRRKVKQAGSQRAAGRLLGVSQGFVSAMIRGDRPISVRVLNKLGFKREVVAK